MELCSRCVGGGAVTSSRPVWGGAGPRPPALEGIARPDVMRPADVEARRPLLCQRTCSRVPVSCFHSELLTPPPQTPLSHFMCVLPVLSPKNPLLVFKIKAPL